MKIVSHICFLVSVALMALVAVPIVYCSFRYGLPIGISANSQTLHVDLPSEEIGGGRFLEIPLFGFYFALTIGCFGLVSFLIAKLNSKWTDFKHESSDEHH